MKDVFTGKVKNALSNSTKVICYVASCGDIFISNGAFMLRMNEEQYNKYVLPIYGVPACSGWTYEYGSVHTDKTDDMESVFMRYCKEIDDCRDGYKTGFIFDNEGKHVRAVYSYDARRAVSLNEIYLSMFGSMNTRMLMSGRKNPVFFVNDDTNIVIGFVLPIYNGVGVYKCFLDSVENYYKLMRGESA